MGDANDDDNDDYDDDNDNNGCPLATTDRTITKLTRLRRWFRTRNNLCNNIFMFSRHNSFEFVTNPVSKPTRKILISPSRLLGQCNEFKKT